MKFRFWLGAGFGVLLVIGLDSTIASFLTHFLTLFSLSDLHRQMLVWLRAPLAVLGSQIVFAWIEPWVLRFRFSAERVPEWDISGVTAFQISSDQWLAPVLTSSNRAVWLSAVLAKELSELELRFLFLRQYAAMKLHHHRWRVIYSAMLLCTVFLPYLILVQMAPYILAKNWIIPTWIALYGLLFVITQFAKGKVTLSQELSSTHLAASWVWNGSQVSENLAILRTKFEKLKNRKENKWPVPVLLNESFLISLTNRHSKSGTSSLQFVAMGFFMAITLLFAKNWLWPIHELKSAVDEGDLKRVKNLITKGTPFNQTDLLSNGRTPLLAAIEKNRIEIADFLLQQGADPNQFHAMGLSPLLVASDHGVISLTQLLIMHGANVNFYGFKGFTPIMLASAHGHVETIEMLIKAGAQINARSRHGSTALLLATQSGQIKVVSLLLKNGADISIRDQDGDNASTIAKRKKNMVIEQLLSNLTQENNAL